MNFFSECVKPHLKAAVIYCIPLFGVVFLSLVVPVSSLDAADAVGRWSGMFGILWLGVGVFIFPAWRLYIALGQGLVRSRMLRGVFAVLGGFLNFWLVGSLVRLSGAGDYLYRNQRLGLGMDSGADVWSSYLKMTELLLAMGGLLVLYAVLVPAWVCRLGRLRRSRVTSLERP
ncbi:hypothetical protein H010_09456 [Hydrogenophaga taeniospiralis CCUG 15921]|uniref:Uncharacterized protein n=1 Tax=Hydrogenophaga taeniospiralis CCUG 15921 TaxID=1281780 RepID=A0A9X4NPT6_9BURK|nr:hypothetical protein [Hydrogenophaga taeniospiralis]MDG5975475.1 hypothetical protein [Hydrogenophaga taeniospiralis CCUG 15921]